MHPYLEGRTRYLSRDPGPDDPWDAENVELVLGDMSVKGYRNITYNILEELKGDLGHGYEFHPDSLARFLNFIDAERITKALGMGSYGLVLMVECHDPDDAAFVEPYAVKISFDRTEYPAVLHVMEYDDRKWPDRTSRAYPRIYAAAKQRDDELPFYMMMELLFPLDDERYNEFRELHQAGWGRVEGLKRALRKMGARSFPLLAESIREQYRAQRRMKVLSEDMHEYNVLLRHELKWVDGRGNLRWKDLDPPDLVLADLGHSESPYREPGSREILVNPEIIEVDELPVE